MVNGKFGTSHLQETDSIAGDSSQKTVTLSCCARTRPSDSYSIKTIKDIKTTKVFTIQLSHLGDSVLNSKLQPM